MFSSITSVFNWLGDFVSGVVGWLRTAFDFLVSSIVDIPVYTSLIPQPFGFILGISFCAIAVCAFLRLFGSNLGGG